MLQMVDGWVQQWKAHQMRIHKRRFHQMETRCLVHMVGTPPCQSHPVNRFLTACLLQCWPLIVALAVTNMLECHASSHTGSMFKMRLYRPHSAKTVSPQLSQSATHFDLLSKGITPPTHSTNECSTIQLGSVVTLLNRESSSWLVLDRADDESSMQPFFRHKVAHMPSANHQQ